MTVNKKDIILESNQTKLSYDMQETIHNLFEKQVELSENKIAVVYKDTEITYDLLNKKANQLARVLRKKGIVQNDIVALMCHRSIDMIIGMLGILKAGGCYLPIDPKFPEFRIQYMLQDSKAKILLLNEDLDENIEYDGIKVFLEEENIKNEDNTNIDNINISKDLIYIIYTSGSTGNPKGVMLEHQSVHNFIEGMVEKIDFSPSKTIVSLTTISFDIFVLESILPLVKGMKIIIADPMNLAEFLNGYKVDMMQTTPSTMKLILADKKNLEYVQSLSDIILGGEEFPKSLLYSLQELTEAKIYNTYGPTETTVWSTVKDLTNQKDITIGKPIANTQIYIMNETNKVLGVNSIGELCIAGDGVARGYLERAELTQERFVKAPIDSSKIMYRTGDLAKWLKNGEIQFCGRMDSQVKIRGFRIELGEIEETLNKFQSIKECVVVAKNNKVGEKYLVAYYLASKEINVSEIIDFLRESLPEYMIPGVYIKIDKIPMTPNNKIDHKALPEPAMKRPKLGVVYIGPETKIEKELVNIWCETLNIELIGVEDNFFELGGNSILVSQLMIKLQDLYETVINIADIFSYPTIRKLSQFIQLRIKEQNLQGVFKTTNFVDYYRTEQEGLIDICKYEIYIDKNTYSNLMKLVSSYEISLESILKASFMYVLSFKCKQNRIDILDITNNDLKYFSLDFSGSKELIYLSKQIEQQEKDILCVKYLLQEDYDSMIIPDGDICTLFLIRNDFNHVLKKNEINLNINLNKEDISISITFNAALLKTRKIKELLDFYKKLLEHVSDENN